MQLLLPVHAKMQQDHHTFQCIKIISKTVQMVSETNPLPLQNITVAHDGMEMAVFILGGHR